MKNTQHTPGPWKYRRQRDGQFIVETEEKALCWLDRHFMPAEADARLIAASPDMLSALHAARIAINADALADSANEGSSWSNARNLAMLAVSAAIAKAEGNA
jgi:hypothetical protein